MARSADRSTAVERKHRTDQRLRLHHHQQPSPLEEPRQRDERDACGVIGPARLRLVAVKNAYDRQNVFRLNANVKPTVVRAADLPDAGA